MRSGRSARGRPAHDGFDTPGRPDVVAVVAGPAAGVAVVHALERIAGFDNGSPAFLLAVVVVAVVRGTVPAIATAIGSFLAYDYFFIEPTFTFTVRDPAEWLNLSLLLTVGIVVGRLAGRERDRAIAAVEGEREATAMFNISFTLAGERDPGSALRPVAEYRPTGDPGEPSVGGGCRHGRRGYGHRVRATIRACRPRGPETAPRRRARRVGSRPCPGPVREVEPRARRHVL